MCNNIPDQALIPTAVTYWLQDYNKCVKSYAYETMTKPLTAFGKPQWADEGIQFINATKDNIESWQEYKEA